MSNTSERAAKATVRFTHVRRGATHLHVDERHREAALRSGLDTAEGLARCLDSSATRGRDGRGPTRIVELPGFATRLHLRAYRHGGLLGPLLGRVDLGFARALGELENTARLRAAGAPVPEPIAVMGTRRGPFVRATLATAEVEGAIDARAWLESERSESRPPARLVEAAHALGVAVRRFHDCGGSHRDLQLANLLLRFGDASVDAVVIDLDRSFVGAPPSPARRAQELARLYRSLDKHALAPVVGRRGLAAFFSAYCDGDRGLRRALLDAIPRERRRLARHRLGWALFGRGRGRAVHRLGSCLLTVGLLMTLPGCRDEPTAAPNAILSLLAVGDTGRTRPLASLFEGQLAVAEAMRRDAERAAVDAVVLLGDNFYWYGLTEEDLEIRLRINLVGPYCAFLRLDGPRSAAVADACRRRVEGQGPVPVYAVLGNHDLDNPESERLERERVPEYVPSWHMAEPLAEVIELGAGTSLVLFESEIAIRDEARIVDEVSRALAAAHGPFRILATHRPIAHDDDGRPSRGGYPEWVRTAIERSGVRVQVVLSGHHHNLQLIEMSEPRSMLQVVAGSGSRAELPLADGLPGFRFGALSLGYVRVDRVGAGDDARLVLTLVSTPSYPILDFLGSRVRARASIDVEGRIRMLPLDAEDGD